MGTCAQMLDRLRRFGGDRSGVAAVEFALILPFLLLLYFGTVEAAALYTADRRVYTVAGTMGDLVSRVEERISTATLNDYFSAAQTIIRPYPAAGLTQIVSVLRVSDAGVARVDWSRGFNGGQARVADSPFPLPASSEFNQMARGGHLVVSEVGYAYRPLLGVVISEPISLSRTEFFLPRYEDGIDLIN